MGLVARGAVPAAALAVVALAAGCGGSVTDADAAPRTRASVPPQTPFCAAAKANADAIPPLNALITRGDPPAAQLAEAVDTVRRAGADLLATAPSEIRDDVERRVRSIDVQLDALVASGGDGAAVNRDPAVAAQAGSPELVAAGERVTAYVTRTCSTGAASTR